jgi:hypothetical protein
MFILKINILTPAVAVDEYAPLSLNPKRFELSCLLSAS